jgi:hypothetical protein
MPYFNKFINKKLLGTDVQTSGLEQFNGSVAPSGNAAFFHPGLFPQAICFALAKHSTQTF